MLTFPIMLNIYFTASLSAKEKYLKNYKAIIDYLESKGHKVIFDHILNATEKSIQMSTREERLDFHNQLQHWIQDCDCMIVEASFPSMSVGYEVGMALRNGKHVLIMYGEGDAPSLFGHHKDDRIIAEKYTFPNIQHTIDDFLRYVKKHDDMRFTFFLSSRLMNYLEDVAREKKVPKSVYLRDLIEKDINSSL